MHSKARRTLVGVAAAVMIAAPAAQAMPIDPVQTGRPAHVGPSSSNTAPVGMVYGELRATDAQEQASGNTSTVESRPVVGPVSAPDGFDWLSAAIAAAGLALVSSTVIGVRRTVGRRAAGA